MPREPRSAPDSCIDIVEALAAAEGVEPLDLGYSLYDHVDVEAIDAMFDHAATEWSVRFEVGGHEVVVHGDRTVVVDGTSRRPAAQPA